MSDRNSPFSFCVIFISHWRNIDYIEVGQIKKKKELLRLFLEAQISLQRQNSILISHHSIISSEHQKFKSHI